MVTADVRLTVLDPGSHGPDNRKHKYVRAPSAAVLFRWLGDNDDLARVVKTVHFYDDVVVTIDIDLDDNAQVAGAVNGWRLAWTS